VENIQNFELKLNLKNFIIYKFLLFFFFNFLTKKIKLQKRFFLFFNYIFVGRERERGFMALGKLLKPEHNRLDMHLLREVSKSNSRKNEELGIFFFFF
jgi:hypothetical protein